jgi:cathepsin D
MWINSAMCSDPGCNNHKKYDHRGQKNFKKIGLDLDVEFGTGELEGEINEDTVYMGGVEVDKQSFAEIVQENGEVFAQSKFDGIVGLAFPQMAAYDNDPVFDNIMKQKKLSKNEFGFYFDNREGQSNS